MKRYYYQAYEQLNAFLIAYNFAKLLTTLKGLTL